MDIGQYLINAVGNYTVRFCVSTYNLYRDGKVQGYFDRNLLFFKISVIYNPLWK